MKRISMTWPMYLRREVKVNGHVRRLTPNETEIISTVLARRGEIVSYEDLVEACYPDPWFEPDSALSCVKVNIVRIKHKIGDRQRAAPVLQTVRGRGVTVDR